MNKISSYKCICDRCNYEFIIHGTPEEMHGWAMNGDLADDIIYMFDCPNCGALLQKWDDELALLRIEE